MPKWYPTWLEAWKDARGSYEEYESPVAKSEEKHEKVQTGKRNKRAKKVPDPEQDADD